jgi:hypothetical protein
MAARVERLNVGSAVEVEPAADLAALERRTKGDRSEQHIVAAEEALDVLDPHTLHAERRRVLLRIALVMPLGTSKDGLPIGVQLIGPYWSEPELLHIARQLATLTKGFVAPQGL